MRLFVTGGSGFVGGHLIEALVGDGHTVRAMARSDGSAEAVAGFGAAPVRCGLGAVAIGDLEGVDAIVHCAAYVEEYGPREAFEAINVGGTRQLLAAARTAGVARFVHMGTEAAVFAGQPLVDIDETYPYPARHRFLYAETKAEAERLVLAANDAALTTLVLRPRLVWGPRDTSILPGILRMAEEGSWVWIDDGARTSTCHVDNLVAAVRLALTEGRGGQAYFVADEEISELRDFVTRLATTQGVTLPGRRLPGAVVRPLGYALEATWRALGIEKTPPLTGLAVAMMSRTVTVDTSKARAELGYRPIVSVEDGLAALTQWTSGDAPGATGEPGVSPAG